VLVIRNDISCSVRGSESINVRCCKVQAQVKHEVRLSKVAPKPACIKWRLGNSASRFGPYEDFHATLKVAFMALVDAPHGLQQKTAPG
jgi:hypothetical protein